MYRMYKEDEMEHADVNIDLRHEASLMEKDFSYKALYVRNCKFVRCTCFNDTEKSGNPKCPKCFGAGHFASIEKINVIQTASTPYTIKSKVTGVEVGALERKDEVYYVEYKVKPKHRDFILKTTWKDGYPVDIIQVLEAANIYEMRMTGGRVELYGINTTNRPDLVKQFNSTLKRLPQKALNVIKKGDKYLWPSLLTYKTETHI